MIFKFIQDASMRIGNKMFIIICDICHVSEGGTWLITLGVIDLL
jgi:hypothetical protein